MKSIYWYHIWSYKNTNLLNVCNLLSSIWINLFHSHKISVCLLTSLVIHPISPSSAKIDDF